MKKFTPNSSTAGFSLIELVVALTLLAAIYGTMFKVLSNQKIQVIKTELTTKGIFLAQDMMNRILAVTFDENPLPPWTSPAALGPELSDISFNDVDDFNGYVSAYYPIDDFPGFTYIVDVHYVDPDVSLDNAVAVTTDVKKIVVSVTHDEVPTVVLETIVSGDSFDEDDPEETMTICHKPDTQAGKVLVIPVSAWPGHEGHGDIIGTCPPWENPPDEDGDGDDDDEPGDDDHHPGQDDDDHHPGETCKKHHHKNHKHEHKKHHKKHHHQDCDDDEYHRRHKKH